MSPNFTIEQLRSRLARPALVFHEGSTQNWNPSSYLGWVSFVGMSEEWPEQLGRPLRPLLQLNLKDTPYRPAKAEKIDLLTLFIDPRKIPADSTWKLRTYRRRDKLRKHSSPRAQEQALQIPLSYPEIVEDFPSLPHLEEMVEQDLAQDFSEKHPCRAGIKFGGWPRLTRRSRAKERFAPRKFPCFLQVEHDFLASLFPKNIAYPLFEKETGSQWTVRWIERDDESH